MKKQKERRKPQKNKKAQTGSDVKRETSRKPVGAVMVVGGGIAGISASLDLANSGYKVYLVEKSPSIGGVMAQLDKTFPTNDCSMCILSPKLVECGRHLNIDLMTLGEIREVKGKPGNFKVTVAQKTRYIDPDKCTGCGQCMDNCPVENIPDFSLRSVYAPLEPEQKAVADAYIKTHGTSGSSLIRVMQELNRTWQYIPKNIVYYLSSIFKVRSSTIYRIGTFYNAFSFEPRGKHIVSICTGTACHIKGASKLIDKVRMELNIDIGGTTDDMLFSLETVRCLGCCSLAPVIKINEKVFGEVKSSDISKIIKDYRR